MKIEANFFAHVNVDQEFDMVNVELEIEFASKFIMTEQRRRLIKLLQMKKGREKAWSILSHNIHFQPECIFEIPSSCQDPRSIICELKKRGAGESSYIISESPEIDGRSVPLDEELFEIIRRGFATIAYCHPPLLAYFEGEPPGPHLILESRRR